MDDPEALDGSILPLRLTKGHEEMDSISFKALNALLNDLPPDPRDIFSCKDHPRLRILKATNGSLEVIKRHEELHRRSGGSVRACPGGSTNGCEGLDIL